jgi:hypothetical protein
MDRDPRANELSNLKEALANFEHQLDAFEARVGYPIDGPPSSFAGHRPILT